MKYEVFHSGYWEKELFLAPCQPRGMFSLILVGPPPSSDSLSRSISGILCARVLCDSAPSSQPWFWFPHQRSSAQLSELTGSAGIRLPVSRPRDSGCQLGNGRTSLVIAHISQMSVLYDLAFNVPCLLFHAPTPLPHVKPMYVCFVVVSGGNLHPLSLWTYEMVWTI